MSKLYFPALNWFISLTLFLIWVSELLSLSYKIFISFFNFSIDSFVEILPISLFFIFSNKSFSDCFKAVKFTKVFVNWFSVSLSWVSKFVIRSLRFDCYFSDFYYKNWHFIFNLLTSLLSPELLSFNWLFLNFYDWRSFLVFYNSSLVFSSSSLVDCSVDLKFCPDEES